MSKWYFDMAATVDQCTGEPHGQRQEWPSARMAQLDREDETWPSARGTQGFHPAEGCGPWQQVPKPRLKSAGLLPPSTSPDPTGQKQETGQLADYV